MTVNSIVALNMAYFRKAAGLTQEELGERIGWGKSVVSTAERSSDARRVRNFSAEDLIAISTALGVPMAALFLPPEDDGVAVRYVIGTAAEDKYATWLLGFFFPTFQGGSSPAMDAYRHRCIVAGTGRQDHILTADDVALARTDIARVKAEALLRDARVEQMEDLQHGSMACARPSAITVRNSRRCSKVSSRHCGRAYLAQASINSSRTWKSVPLSRPARPPAC